MPYNNLPVMQKTDQNWNSMKTVGGFSISTQLLGSGTFAKTYLSRNIANPDQQYACKLINKNCMNGIDQETWNTHKQYFVRRLQEEVRIWKQLRHPHVVKFHCTMETSRSVYLFLQLCEGGNLEQYMKKNVLIPEVTVLTLAKQLLSCGSFLYQKGIIHRDIKPENIMFSQGILKVSDFGLAKMFEKDDLNKQKTLTVAGSPSYMAPEVLQGKKYGLKCDVWSMGVVIYQLFMGNLPYQLTEVERSGIKILKNIKQNKLKFPKPLNAGIYALLAEMLEVDPNNRLSMPESLESISKIKEEDLVHV